MLLGVMPNMHLLGINWFHAMPSNPAVEVLAQLGVLILLFESGLEFTVRDMMNSPFAHAFRRSVGIGMIP